MPDDLPLSGLTLVLTRPRQQGERTAQALRNAGATVVEMPMLEILPRPCRVDRAMLNSAYAAIFVSANAVEHGVPCLNDNGGLPVGTLIAAIGHATSRALNDAGFADVVSPQQSIDSEGLLAVPQLQQAQIKGQHVVLVRGASAGGGRKLIEETLMARGATVIVMECYERRELPAGPGQIEFFFNGMKSNFAVTVLSVETLDSLMNSFASHETLLKSAGLLVPHERVAAAAKERGFANVHEIPMSAEALIPALHALKSRLVARTT